jgi:hypothetical protein
MKYWMILLLLSFSALALEVDEKLTLRLLKTSETKKTLLINRGTEDGIVEGDHAKFFVSAGVVARGVCIKVSPARSVWSIYRLVNADFLITDSVMNLKITPAVRITNDESKMIVQEDTPSVVAQDDIESLGIPLAEGAKDLSASDQASLQGQSQTENMMALGLIEGNIRQRNDEIVGLLALANLSGRTSTGGATYAGGDGLFLLQLAWEHYFKNEQEWWGRFSPILFYNVQRQQTLALQGSRQMTTLNEFGGGLNWHPWTPQSVANAFIPFLHFSMAMGNSSSTYEPGSENALATTVNQDGKTFGFAMGVGAKFYTMKGYGARLMLDYNSRTESFTDLTGAAAKRTLSGLRIFSGFSYRW